MQNFGNACTALAAASSSFSRGACRDRRGRSAFALARSRKTVGAKTKRAPNTALKRLTSCGSGSFRAESGIGIQRGLELLRGGVRQKVSASCLG